MTLQTVLDEIRKRPGTGDVIPVIDPVDRRTDHRVHRLRRRGGQRGRRAGEGILRVRRLVASLPGSERAKVLWRIADLIDEHADVLADSTRSTPVCR